jgi:hypothetical protein
MNTAASHLMPSVDRNAVLSPALMQMCRGMLTAKDLGYSNVSFGQDSQTLQGAESVSVSSMG